jgi:hypothetical protein
MSASPKGKIRPNPTLPADPLDFPEPAAAAMKTPLFEAQCVDAQAELAAFTLQEPTNYDLLHGQLTRAKAVAAVIACAAAYPGEVTPGELSEAAWLIRYELDKALIVLKNMAEERGKRLGGHQ